MRKRSLAAMLVALCLFMGLCPAVCFAEDVYTLELSSQQETGGAWSHSVLYNGQEAPEYDYTWHADPSAAHEEVKDVPGVYYTGTKPSGDDPVYIAHDIYYYPELPVEGFVRQNYDGETEWCYYYTAEGYTDYVFSTLPVQGNSVPEQMMHSEAEAYDNAVLHITRAGTYSITGDWHGQIRIDLGEDAFTDPTAKVTLILNGVDVTCTVAASLVFANVYECDNTWEEQESWSAQVDTAEAGANIIVADGTVNNFSGTNIFRILKTKFKKDTAVPHTGAAQKKYLKVDAAFYSYMSMNIDGQQADTGVLNVNSGFEGLDTELHLTFNGANVNITSQDDGINVNEDGVSVVTVNDGSLHIVAGVGAEGDGIDSNGFLVINGGTVISCAKPAMDSGLDSDMGSFINGGYVVATGSTMDWAESDSEQVTMNLQFAGSQASDEAVIVTDLEGKVVFAYDPDKDETTGAYNRGYRGAVISAPQFQVGQRYHVYVGGDVYGTEVNGLYDADTVTGFSSDAVRQGYTGTDVGMGFPGGFRPEEGNMPFPEGFRPEEGNMPFPEGFRPEEGGMPFPEGFRPEEGGMPGRGDGMGGMPPSGELPPDLGAFDQAAGQTGPMRTDFYMTDKVNAFSGVADAADDESMFDGAADADFTQAMTWAVTEGILESAGAAFDPNAACTRGQLVTFLWKAAGSPASAGANPFADVAEDSGCYEAVLWAAEKGIAKGTGDTTFAPETAVTRGQAVTFLHRANGAPAAEGQGFADVAADAYYADAVLWAVQEGVTVGTGDNSFGPNSPCTCGQIITFLYRSAK